MTFTIEQLRELADNELRLVFNPLAGNETATIHALASIAASLCLIAANTPPKMQIDDEWKVKMPDGGSFE